MVNVAAKASTPLHSIPNREIVQHKATSAFSGRFGDSGREFMNNHGEITESNRIANPDRDAFVFANRYVNSQFLILTSPVSYFNNR